MASISFSVKLASLSASLKHPEIAIIWLREATSGTTPPNFLWISICEATIFDKTSLPFLTTLTAVSSHEDSMARMVTSFFKRSASNFSFISSKYLDIFATFHACAL